MSMTFASDPTIKDDYGFDHLRRLRASVCVDIVKNPDTDHGQDEYGLVFRKKDGSIVTAWIMCDPEGNGPGHLDLVEGKR